MLPFYATNLSQNLVLNHFRSGTIFHHILPHKNCGLSPQAALKASKRVRFDTTQKPDSVITFFREQGFSFSQIQRVISSAPDLLTCDLIKRVLPKFQILASKGASNDDIVATVTRSPGFLRRSHEKQVIPAFDLIRRFFAYDPRAVARVLACPTLIGDARFQYNLKKLTYEERKNKLIARLQALNSAADAQEDDDDE